MSVSRIASARFNRHRLRYKQYETLLFHKETRLNSTVVYRTFCTAARSA